VTDTPATNYTVFRLPRSHWHCHLWNFDWTAVTPKSLEHRITDFLHGAQDGKAPHVLLTGAPGIGKSHLGVGVYRTACTVFGTELVTWLNVPAFCDSVKRSYGPDSTDPWADYEGARRLVVLDDLFGRDLSQHEVAQIVYRLIDTAYQNGASVLVNMNQDVKELTSRLASHEISRLLAGSTIIPMTASKDYRRG
jgi:DNA replication protein DnaC